MLKDFIMYSSAILLVYIPLCFTVIGTALLDWCADIADCSVISIAIVSCIFSISIIGWCLFTTKKGEYKSMNLHEIGSVMSLAFCGLFVGISTLFPACVTATIICAIFRLI